MKKGRPIVRIFVIVIVFMMIGTMVISLADSVDTQATTKLPSLLIESVSPSTIVFPAGMISYWKLDEGSGIDAVDCVADNDGILTNGPVWTTGKVQGALSFDGSNDYVEIIDSDDLDLLGPLTLEAWIKPNQKEYQCYILAKRDYATGPGAADANYELFIGTPTDPKYLTFTVGNVTHYSSLRALTPITFGSWNHIVTTYNSSSLSIFVNGSLIASGKGIYDRSEHLVDPNGIIVPKSNTDNLTIGALKNRIPMEGFYGVIDEVAIYSLALTQEEIQQHYQDGLNGFGYEEFTPTPPDYLSEDWVEKAIDWAFDQKDKSNWNELCMAFVSDAFKVSENRSSSADTLRTRLVTEGGFYSEDTNCNPPRGTLVFFSANPPYAEYGHIGISMDNQEVIHALGTVGNQSITEIEESIYIDSYLGWAYPPEEFFLAELSDQFSEGDIIFKDEGWNLRDIPSCYGTILASINGTGEIIEDEASTTDMNGIRNGGSCGVQYWWRVRIGDYEGWCAEDGLEKITIPSFCFIATAAYGTPMVDEVQTLRDFRDEYLLTNPLGQAFTNLYYEISPPIAEFITENPSLKPIVRAALLPAVTMSAVVVDTSPVEKIAIVVSLVLVSVAIGICVIRRQNRGPEYS